MIKQNEVAFLKTTGEAVFVMITNSMGVVGDVKVRRPMIGQNGVKHVIETFQIEELETLEEQNARFMAERKDIYEKYGPKAESFPPIN
jgi:hypothetical protein